MEILRADDIVKGHFSVMACPCEVLLETDDDRLGMSLVGLAQQEAKRIEAKFSRFQVGNEVDRINKSGGKPIEVDDETAQLLNFCARGYEISNGLFDVTYNSVAPSFVGWTSVSWDGRTLCLPPGVSIDFGGMGKEYAVDRAVNCITQQSSIPVLVNFGGDIATGGRRAGGETWAVGIEQPDKPNEASGVIHLTSGAIATSGDTKRPGHIRDPRTGLPIVGAPRSVTVAAATCTEAGFLSTLGMLQGERAEDFLTDAGVRFWCVR